MEIIANPGSGKGNGKKVLEAVKTFLNGRGIEYSVRETTGVGHAKQLAAEASARGAEVIVALGGDGTFHEVLNGIDFNVSRMGMIPAGRGNDFAIGAKAASLDPIRAIADIVKGEPRELDYIQISDKRCLNIAGTGLDVEVLLRTANKRNKITYINSLVHCLLHYKPYRVAVEIDGETKEYDCIMAGVANGTQFGGGIKLSPISKPDDGKLDVIIMVKPKRVPTLFIMPKFVKGKHMQKPYTIHIRCDALHISTSAPLELDGEIYYDLDFDAKIVKNGVKTFVPTITD